MLGSATVGYDTLLADVPNAFAISTCAETQDSDTTAIITAEPPLGQALYFNVRAGNSCGLGPGGVDSNGVARTLPTCP